MQSAKTPSTDLLEIVANTIKYIWAKQKLHGLNWVRERAVWRRLSPRLCRGPRTAQSRVCQGYRGSDASSHLSFSSFKYICNPIQTCEWVWSLIVLCEFERLLLLGRILINYVSELILQLFLCRVMILLFSALYRRHCRSVRFLWQRPFEKRVGVVNKLDSRVVGVLCLFQYVVGQLTYVGGLEDGGGGWRAPHLPLFLSIELLAIELSSLFLQTRVHTWPTLRSLVAWLFIEYTSILQWSRLWLRQRHLGIIRIKLHN